MTSRAEICAEARRWIGTPYQHQAHLRGVGCDCGGLVGGIAVALGIVRPDWWETDFAPWAGYSAQPSGDGLARMLAGFMAPADVGSAQAGDVVVMRFRRDPQHIGVLVPYVHGGLAMVHALSGIGVQAVTEARIDARWQRRITHAFVFPGVA